MELFERRRYYYCSYCGAFHFIENEPIEGIRALGTPDDALACPVCHGPLAKALLDDMHVVRHCGHCRGALLPRQTFAQVVTARRRSARGAAKTPGRVDRREQERELTCPQCGQRMDVHPYYGPGNVIIDTCSRCDAIWLDSGELGQITDAPGGDRRN